MTTPGSTPTISGAYFLTVDYDYLGQPAQSVLGLRTTGGVFLTATDGQQALNAWWAAVRGLCSVNNVCKGGTIRPVQPAAPVFELTAPPSSAGAVTTGTNLPAYSTLIKWRSNIGGRRGKGRTYLPGLTAGNVESTGRSFAPAYVTSVNSAITAYLGNTVFSDAGMVPAIISRATPGAWKITAGSLAPIPGVQRRRMRA